MVYPSCSLCIGVVCVCSFFFFDVRVFVVVVLCLLCCLLCFGVLFDVVVVVRLLFVLSRSMFYVHV